MQGTRRFLFSGGKIQQATRAGLWTARAHVGAIGKAVLCVSVLMASAAQGQAVLINYHERPQGLSLASPAPGNNISAKTQADSRSLSFTAFGRQFEIALEINDRILATWSPQARASLQGTQLFRGSLVGVPGSWVRLTQTGNSLSGLIWDGAELYNVDEYAEVAELLSVPEANPTPGPIIYRWSEVVGTLKDRLFQVPVSQAKPAGGNQTANSQKATSGPVVSFATGLAIPQQIDIGVVADVEFFQLEGANTEAAMLGVFNTVDGIYTADVGVQINVPETVVFSAEADPFSATDVGAILSELATYKDTTPAFQAQGLLHLFSGKDVDSSSGSSVVGAANVGVLCEPRFGVGVTEARFSASINALIVAHELGHNFGAPHDTEAGSACENAPAGFLMEPSINGSNQFSQCSVDEMLLEIATVSCLSNLATADMALQTLAAPPASVSEGGSTPVQIRIDNNSNLDATSVELLLANSGFSAPTINFLNQPAGGSCDTANPMRCTWPLFASADFVDAEIVFVAQAPGLGTIDLSVSTPGEVDTSNNNLHYDINITPLPPSMGDIVVSLSGPTDVMVSEIFNFDLVVRNDGPDMADNIEVRHQDLGATLATSLTAVTTTLGTCTMVPPANDFICQTPQLATGQSYTISLTGAATQVGAATLAAQATSTTMDGDVTNNLVNQSVNVMSPPTNASPPAGGANAGGGGGGAGGPVVLWLLLSAYFVRRQRYVTSADRVVSELATAS